MNEKLRQIEHVIGIDFGHGETSAAICSLQWDTSVDQLEFVKDLKLSGNNAVIPSAITFLDDGSAYVGESAFNIDLLKHARVHVGFKRKPERIDGEAEKIMIRFMKEVYNLIRSTNAGILTEGNHLVYIATPSGWDKDTKNLYVKMAQAAGLPTPDDGVTSESRAAFVKAQHDATLLLGRCVDKGAVVVDMGSSTLDFTYMNTRENVDHPIDNGYDCGASHVEKAILNNLERENESIRRFEEKYPELRDYLMYEVRKFKEEVYTKPNERIRRTYNFEDFIDDMELEDERFKIVFMPGELDQILEKEGYVDSIRQAMLDFRNNFIPNKPIYGVLLTGGASRMSFIKQLVCSCWDLEEDLVHYDIDPSLTISRGVAEVARMDLRTGGMEKGLEQEIKDLENSDKIFNTFIDKFTQEFITVLSESLKAAVDSYATSDVDLCRNDLLLKINVASDESAQKMKETAPRILQMAVETNLQGIQEKVENIRRHYVREGMTVDVSYDVSIPKFNDMDLNLSNIIKNIVDTIVNDDAFMGNLFTGGGLLAALAVGGPLGWAIGGGVLALKFLFGKSEEEKQKEEMNTKLIKAQRMNDRGAILPKMDEILQNKETEKQVKDKLVTDPQVKTTVMESVVNTLQSYRENLKAARILID